MYKTCTRLKFSDVDKPSELLACWSSPDHPPMMFSTNWKLSKIKCDISTRRHSSSWEGREGRAVRRVKMSTAGERWTQPILQFLSKQLFPIFAVLQSNVVTVHPKDNEWNYPNVFVRNNLVAKKWPRWATCFKLTISSKNGRCTIITDMYNCHTYMC